MMLLEIGTSVALGAFIAAVFAGIDNLLLSRQIEWLNAWASRWYAFFDALTVPNLPRHTVALANHASPYFLWPGILGVSIFAVTLLVAYALDLIEPAFGIYAFWIGIIGVLLLVFWGVFKILNYFRGWGWPLVASVMLIGLIFGLMLMTDPRNITNEDVDLVAAAFSWIFLGFFFAPVFGFLGFLLLMYALVFAFWLFKMTTSHLLALSVERKTIFAHLGTFIGLLVALGKFVRSFGA